MTAPDRSVKIEPKTLAGGSRPHMSFAEASVAIYKQAKYISHDPFMIHSRSLTLAQLSSEP